MKKTIITVVGKDTVGIIAKVCTYLADNRINILDIAQTIVQGYFNMMMVVDTSGGTKEHGDMADDLARLGELSEKYVHSDPNTSVIKQGMLAEIMVKYMLASARSNYAISWMRFAKN